MKVLCTICARGGSQGIKNKNLILLRRKPLIAHTILQAKHSGLFNIIAVSSDSPKIRRIAKKWGANYIIERPLEMATATAAKLPAIKHAVLEIEQMTSQQFDIIIDLDVTSPLRSLNDLAQAYQLFLQHPDAQNLVTGFPARRSPYFNMLEIDEAGYAKLAKQPDKAIVRRQDTPACYDMNASIYIWKKEALLNAETTITNRTLLYPMPEERSIDIDSTMDLQLVKLLAKTRQDLV